MNSMSTPDEIYTPNTVVIEWAYTPPDFLKGFDQIDLGKYVVQIGAGKLYARVPIEQFDATADVKQTLDAELRGVFAAAQLVVKEPYTLNPPAHTRVDENGRRYKYLSGHAAGKSHTGDADLVITDAQGNVVSDPAAERRARVRRLADLARRHRHDPTAAGILASFDAAMNDPADELVHLYEIRDRLQKHFKGAEEAQEALGVSLSQWQEFGKLADKEPVRQGRHRGGQPLPLRDATERELNEARDFAARLIEGYLLTLQDDGDSGGG